jgi:hypothetical protein
MPSKFSIRLAGVLFASAAISLAAANAGYARGGGGHSGAPSAGNAMAQPNHGPGSSHNPIVYHPVHGPGSSHNPIVVQSQGTVTVRDHRRPCYYHCNSPYHLDLSTAEGGRKVTSINGRYPDNGNTNRDHRSH